MDEGKLVRVFRDASRWKDDEMERKWRSTVPEGVELVQRYVASLPPGEASSSTVMHVAAVVAAACSWILGSDWWTRCCLYSWAATTAHGPCMSVYVIVRIL